MYGWGKEIVIVRGQPWPAQGLSPGAQNSKKGVHEHPKKGPQKQQGSVAHSWVIPHRILGPNLRTIAVVGFTVGEQRCYWRWNKRVNGCYKLQDEHDVRGCARRCDIRVLTKNSKGKVPRMRNIAHYKYEFVPRYAGNKCRSVCAGAIVWIVVCARDVRGKVRSSRVKDVIW